MGSRLKVGTLLLHVVVVLVVIAAGTAGTADQTADCANSDAAYSLPCNPEADPWTGTRTKVDELTSEPADSGISMWMRIRYGKDKVNTVVNTPDKLSKAAKAVAESLRDKTKKAAETATEVATTVAKKAKGAARLLQKSLKILGAIASAAQFLGPIIDIILLFAPLAKSRELKAIESGFAKMGGKIDSIAYQLGNIEGAMDWNAIVTKLMEFEGSVDQTTKKYISLVKEIEAIDPSQELPLIIKSHIEDLVDAIKNPGDIANQLQLVDNLFKGNSGFTKGKTLLEMFIVAVDNDCSKISSMANKLILIVKNAQRLEYFYELNQKLIKPSDDKGYPKMLYDMYKESITQYTKCTNNAPTYAQKEMKVMYGNSETLPDIIDKLQLKYELYNWATMKESDKKEKHFALIDNSAIQLDVELSGLAEDQQGEQSLTLFAIRKSTNTEVDDAVARVKIVLTALNKADLPRFGEYEDWSDSTKFRDDILKEVRDKFKKDTVLKSLIDKQRMTMVMFEDDSGIVLDGWHYQSNMEVLKIFISGAHYQSTYEKYLGFTLGFSFNFEEDTDDFSCINGHTIYMAFEGSFPYCLCSMDYGGDSCDISLENAPASTFSNSVLDLVEMYKVPGMFDLQDDVRKGTDKIMQELENNKQEIFTVVRQTGADIEKSKNAILSAQSIMLNDLKAGNARLLKEFSGLGAAMEAAFERQRNELIYRTEEGQDVVIKTIDEGNRKVIDSINRLTGKVIENRYFQQLRLHIPVFQKEYKAAIDYGHGRYGEEYLSEYLYEHKQQLLASKEAVKKAMVATDSYVITQMQSNMVDGCTDEYKEKVISTWREMMQLHAEMNVIELWDLDYRIRTSENKDAIEYFKYKRNLVDEEAKSDTIEFNTVYKSSSCPAFAMSALLGGGCGTSMTYPSQSVPMQCSDPITTLVLASTGEVISEVVCQSDMVWAVNVENLRCVSKCVFEGKNYDVGVERRLLDAPSGYYITDKDGNAITESTCLSQTESDFTNVTIVSWSNYPATVLPGYSSGVHKYDSLQDAQVECLQRNDCGGITFEPQSRKYTLRKSTSPTKIAQEISWLPYENTDAVDPSKCSAPTISGGTVSPSTAISPGASYSVTCNDGHTRKGPATISCTDNAGQATRSARPTCVQDCADNSKFAARCERWHSSGYCDSDHDFYKTASSYCARTCGICDQAGVPQGCADIYRYCPMMVSSGHCDSGSEFYGSMSRYCPLSCGFCEEVSWSSYPATVLPGYSSGEYKYDSLQDAQVECLQRTDCGGITFEPQSRNYTLRQSTSLTKIAQEISWLPHENTEPVLSLFDIGSGTLLENRPVDSISNEGILMVSYGTAKGTVCASDFDYDMTNIFCTKLGYTYGLDWRRSRDMQQYTDQQASLDNIVYPILECNLDASTELVMCQSTNSNCKHGDDVWLHCGNTKGEVKRRASWSIATKTDINECATSDDFCGFGGTCTNIPGSFKCTCPTGFSVGPDEKCEDVNECMLDMVGYNKCLIQTMLGACKNTDGSYTCTCLAGSYTTPDQEDRHWQCTACNCNQNGVTASVCDGETGVCSCSTNVGGADCGNCNTGYTNFPYCNQCDAGYSDYPRCEKCSNCVDSGVSAQYCDANTGECDCKANVAGSRCDRCEEHYKSFPGCVPDVQNADLSSWGEWTGWEDQDRCGPSYRGGYNQKRSRKRTCNDATKNIHGTSCKGEKLDDIQTKFYEVCKQVTGVYVTLPDDYYAGTGARLWMGIRQGDNECSTSEPTWDGLTEPESGVERFWRWGTSGCTHTFDYTKPINLYLYSSGVNAVYVTEMGAKIGHMLKKWSPSSRYVDIEKGHNNGWYTTTS